MAPTVPAWRSFAWRLGMGAPALSTVRAHVGRVASDLDARATAEGAARALGLPGLYRSPACWGGDAPEPEPRSAGGLAQWAARCQAASFEIAAAIGQPALAFVVENAFGPFEALHGPGLRALFRLGVAGAVDGDTLGEALDRLEGLDPASKEVALDGLIRAEPAPAADPSVRQRVVERLEGLARRAKSVRARLATLDPLARLDPDRARRFLPDLRRLLAREDGDGLGAALLVRALDPRDVDARDVLRRWADEHPDAEVRWAIEARLRPPRRAPGGRG